MTSQFLVQFSLLLLLIIPLTWLGSEGPLYVLHISVSFKGQHKHGGISLRGLKQKVPFRTLSGGEGSESGWGVFPTGLHEEVSAQAPEEDPYPGPSGDAAVIQPKPGTTVPCGLWRAVSGAEAASLRPAGKQESLPLV